MTPLAERLAVACRERPMPFSDFMAAALYDPEHGYYAKGPRIGAEGDFFTSASLPGFAESVAAAAQAAWERLGRPAPFPVVELGAGTGELAVGVRDALAAAGVPARVVCVEPSAGLAAAQRARGLLTVPDLSMAGRLAGAFVLANEVLDALPVHRVRGADDGGLEELYVAWSPERRFHEVPGPLTTPALDLWFEGAEIVPGQVYEPCLLYGALARALAKAVTSGFVTFIDYGDERPAIHAPERAGGTVRAFRDHRLVDDVFADVGEQDLTASVDFTALRREAEFAGFAVAGFATQGAWLMQHGIVERYAEMASKDPLGALKAKTLFVPGGMGDAFKVMTLAKNAR